MDMFKKIICSNLRIFRNFLSFIMYTAVRYLLRLRLQSSREDLEVPVVPAVIQLRLSNLLILYHQYGPQVHAYLSCHDVQ